MLHPNPLAPGHCMIVPNERVWGMSEAGEEVHAEFGKWCGALRRMFYSTGAGVVMMETVMGGTSPARKMMAHTKIDVIPVAPRVVGDCPLFFKKARALGRGQDSERNGRGEDDARSDSGTEGCDGVGDLRR